MDRNSIFSIFPVQDAAGNLYVPTHILPYDGGILRCRADRVTPGNQRESGFLLEEFCPRVFLPYLVRLQQIGRLAFEAEGSALAADFEEARMRFCTRLCATPQINAFCGTPNHPFICPFQIEQEVGASLIVTTGSMVTLREFVKSSRSEVLTAAYVRQCLEIILALTRKLNMLEERWFVSALTPDSVLISRVSDESGVHVQLSDAAYLFPLCQTPFEPFSFPFSWRKGDFTSDDFTDRQAAEMLGASINGGSCPLPPEVNGLYSVSQLLCYLLFVKPWNLNAETLSIRFPPIGVLQRRALRESLEEAVVLGLRLRPSAPGCMRASGVFEQLLMKAMEESRDENETVFPS